ncbi:MAG TPA: hypothetical protein VM307_11760, partial [Egibacteraceae bacterium]|nr:hypothetical protein [Egibacteraceae bacterium]
MPLTRRTLLRHAAAGIAGLTSTRLVAAVTGATAGVVASAPAAGAAAVTPFSRRLPIPEVLTGSNITLTARPADVQLLPG